MAFSGKVVLSHTLSIYLLSGVATDHTCREGGREGWREGGREGGRRREMVYKGGDGVQGRTEEVQLRRG